MSGSRAEAARRCALGRGLERDERAAAVGLELDPVGRGLDDPDAEHRLPELGQFGRIGRIDHHRPQPTHRLSHLGPPPRSRTVGSPRDRTVGSSVSGPCRPTTTTPRPSPGCSPRRRGSRSTRTSSRRTPSSASPASTRRAHRWSPPPGSRSRSMSRSPRSTRWESPTPRRASPMTRSCARAPDPGPRAGLLALSVTVAAPLLDAFIAGDTLVETVALGATASPGRIVGPPDGAPVATRVVNERYQAEVPTLLTGSLAHDLLWSGPGAGQYEEVVLHALVALGAPPAPRPHARARAHRHRARPPPEFAGDHVAQLAPPRKCRHLGPRRRRPRHHPRRRAGHADTRLLEHPVRERAAGRDRRTRAARCGAAPRHRRAATGAAPLRRRPRHLVVDAGHAAARSIVLPSGAPRSRSGLVDPDELDHAQ